MFIRSALTRGYTRISQNSIKELKITFTQPMQIILGSNGSGKSSIMEQFGGLPPVSADYTKDGCLDLDIDHNGSDFKIISDQALGHFFSKDGEVLNNYGTATVQKSLIEKHLGITQPIWDVISNGKNFTDMTPIERRQWVMYLSKLDINPLMEVFNNAKQRQRDVKGHLSKVAERLKVEVRNTVSEENLTTLTDQLASLKDEFNYYSKFGEEHVQVTSKQDIDNKSRELIDFMESIMSDYPKVPSWLLEQGVKNPTDIGNLIIDRRSRLTWLEDSYAKAMEELKEINKLAEAKRALESVGVHESETRMTQLQTKRNSLIQTVHDSFQYVISGGLASLARNDYLRVVGELRTSIFELPNNDDYRFNSEAYQKALALEHGLISKLTDVKESIYKREHLIEHIDKAEEIVCPSCTYSYKHGIGKHDQRKATEELVNFKESRDKLILQITDVKEFLKDCSEFIDKIKGIYSTMKLTPSNEALWVEIRKLEIFKTSKFRAIELLDDHLKQLELLCEAEETDNLYNKERDVWIKAKESLDIVNNSNHSNVSKIDETVYNLSNEISDLKSVVNKAVGVKNRFDLLEERLTSLEARFSDFNVLLINELDNDRATFIRDTKFNIMKEVNIVEQELEQAKTKNLIFKDITDEYEKAKQEYEDYSIIVDNLSPNTGLLADILNGSITSFTDNLNSIIMSVWTSTLLVLPCINKKNDLDWKFPVRVEENLIRPDIGKTSSSQKDIINLAFKLIVIKHIGIGNYPICLDELGSQMDEQHRINTMGIIEELISGGYCSQIFFISHHTAFHEQFTKAETLVLNTKNLINIPTYYNQHVRIS